MSSIADINTKVAEAIALHEAGDVAGALVKLRSARMLLAATPDTTAGDTSLRFDRVSIDAMITDLVKVQAGSAGVRATKVKYRNPHWGLHDDCD